MTTRMDVQQDRKAIATAKDETQTLGMCYLSVTPLSIVEVAGVVSLVYESGSLYV